MSHTKIKEITTSGGFSQGDNEPRISFVFDYEVENEDRYERKETAFAKAVVTERHRLDSRAGWRGKIWQFFRDGDYDSTVHNLGVVRQWLTEEECRSPEADALRLRSEAEAIGDEYVKVLGQVPALFEQAMAWGEKNGLKVEVDAYQGEFDIRDPADQTIRGTMGFDIHADPLRFDPGDEATAKLKAQFERTKVWKKAQEEERAKRREADIPYEQKRRSNAAQLAASTRKLNKQWSALQEAVKRKV